MKENKKRGKGAKIQKPESRFLEVECRKCKEVIIVFDKASTYVECSCGEEIVLPTGGYAEIRGRILNVLE